MGRVIYCDRLISLACSLIVLTMNGLCTACLHFRTEFLEIIGEMEGVLLVFWSLQFRGSSPLSGGKPDW